MTVVNLKELLDSGVHFGHQTHLWNPKMSPYIYTARNGVHIIDLVQTAQLLDEACNYLKKAAENGKKVLFVGTKCQAAGIIAQEASRCGGFYINKRWLGGMLTNWETIKSRVARLKELEALDESGALERRPKKEASMLQRELNKLQKYLGGIKNMRRVPDIVIIVDTCREHNAVQECQELRLPIISMLDTNCNPDLVDLPIPANDDAIRSIKLIMGKLADAIYEGRHGKAIAEEQYDEFDESLQEENDFYDQEENDDFYEKNDNFYEEDTKKSISSIVTKTYKSNTKNLETIYKENRYLNCSFCLLNTKKLIPTNQPLNLNIFSYQLKVNIGKFWGIGTNNVAFPDDSIKALFKNKEYLELDVAVNSFDVEINSPIQKLKLLPKGDTEYIFFNLTFNRTGRHSIDIDLLLQGHLLQSKRIEVDVVENAEDEPPKSAFPVQDAYVTWTRAVSLSPEDLKPLQDKPRKLTIVAERDIDYNRIGLRFYDTEGTDLGFQQSTLTDAKLTKVLTVIRKQLCQTMNAYSGTLGSTEAVLTKHLGELAVIGRKFYLALLPGLDYQEDIHDDRQRLNVDLKPETVIQVAPLSSALGVPWELLYERKIESYQEGVTKLCPTWHQHGANPEDCPSYGTEEEEITVCPHSFWGYRYIVEQLPCKLEPHKPLPKNSLPLFIRNNLPLLVNATVFNNFKRLAHHWEELGRLASAEELKFLRIDSREGFKQMIKNYGTNPADILYFYTHGGIDDFDDSPYLTIGNGDKIQLIDLDAWEMKFDQHQPLIVLNACDTADYTPDNFENLLQFFCDRGAAGVIGTQCEVKEMLANAFMVNFFQSFLQQNPAGEALFKSRHSLLREHLDPRGLAYSLFASADVKLAQPVVNSKIKTPTS